MFDKEAFLAAIRERGTKLSAVARALRISPSTLHRKMTGQSDFTRGEVQKCCEWLEVQDATPIFFSKKVP